MISDLLGVRSLVTALLEDGLKRMFSLHRPGKYESYVDLLPGEWTRVKIEVRGEKARLYVNGQEQPTLLVNDLKQKVTRGAVALWIGNGTVAHFANVRISP